MSLKCGLYCKHKSIFGNCKKYSNAKAWIIGVDNGRRYDDDGCESVVLCTDQQGR